MSDPCTPDALLEAVRGLRVAEPDLGFKPLLAKLRAQQPDLGAATKEVREALAALKAENEATKAAAAAPPAADKGGMPSNVALSLACIGCARCPSDMDDGREKHPICDMCRDEKLPTTYLCGKDCPANPGAWDMHGLFHKKLRKHRRAWKDGGATQRQHRDLAEREARRAAQTGDKYRDLAEREARRAAQTGDKELLAEGTRFMAKEDYRKAAKANREAIALRPDRPTAYFNLGNALINSGHHKEAGQCFLEAMERFPAGSEHWASATAKVFVVLHAQRESGNEVATPEWWNAFSARVVKTAPNDGGASIMRAVVLSGQCDGAWKVGPRSAAELNEAAEHFERAAVLCPFPAQKARLAGEADFCRRHAAAISR